MLAIYFLHNCAAYGCMTFLYWTGLKGQGFTSPSTTGSCLPIPVRRHGGHHDHQLVAFG